MGVKGRFVPGNSRSVLLLLVLGSQCGAGALFAGTPTGLFISEYVEGTLNNKALEIFNGGDTPVDLASELVDVQIYFNGSVTAGATVGLSGILPSGGTWVVTHSSAAQALLDFADQTSSSVNFNGNDAVVLRANLTVIDSIGTVGIDPGTEWGSGGTTTANHTLRRDAAICLGDVNTADAFDPFPEWIGFALDDFSGLGAHVSNCSAYVFNDGFESGGTAAWSATEPPI